MPATTPFSIGVLDAAFGVAEVRGLDATLHATDASAAAALRDALWRHGVVCVRLPGALTDDEARALAAMIGPVKDPVGRNAAGEPLRYGEERQIIDAGFVMTDEIRALLGDTSFGGDSVRPGLFEDFHTDDSFVPAPAFATMLHARALPASGGGATQFIDMRAAFQLLDAELRARLVGVHAVHAYNNQNAFPPRASATGEWEALVEVAHPVVRAHPHADTVALYFDLDRATHLVDLPVDEGRALLQQLQTHAEEHAPRYAHDWQTHDVLMWDNASVQHRASSDFAVGEERRFWRYMIEGEPPVPAG